MTYTTEDLTIDAQWIEGNSIDEDEAKDFIKKIIANSGGKIDDEIKETIIKVTDAKAYIGHYDLKRLIEMLNKQFDLMKFEVVKND